MNSGRLPVIAYALGVLFLLVVLGLAYGLWSETLEINGTVYTGEVYGEWYQCFCLDSGKDPNPLFQPPKDKDVGSTTCQVDAQDPRILHITVTNGYPSYYNKCNVAFKNSGTVPVIIRGYKIVPENFTLASAYGANNGELWVKFTDGVGVQMEPCPAHSCEQSSEVQLHVEQPAAENTIYKFRVQICIAQWNEDPNLDQCLAAAAP